MIILKTIIDFFVSLIVIINKFFLYFFKRGFLGYLKEKLENNCYINKEIINHKIIFFCPNKLIEWRVETFLNKEPETLEWINNFDDNENIIFWDIGANIGLYSIYASLKSKNISIIAFEPSTSNLRVLSRNISINNLDDKIKIVSQPLNKEKNIFSKFNESSFQEGGALNTFKENYNFTGKKFNSENKYHILGTNINNLIDQKILEIPNYIKIDVDGIEHLILKGGDKYLRDKKVKSILVEINEKFEAQFNEIKDIMLKCNFILKKKERNESFYQNSDYEKMYNYIFIKK